MARSEPISAPYGITGLVGTVGYTVTDTAGNELVARTTAGITESFPGVYFATASLPDTACLVIWDDSGGNLFTLAFEAVGTSSDVDATPTTRTLRFTHKVGTPAVETDLDTPPVLRDTAATYGVKRADTGTVISPDPATPTTWATMTRVSTGVYEYDLGSAYVGVPLVYAVEYTYGGGTPDHEDGIVSLGASGGHYSTVALIQFKLGQTNADKYAAGSTADLDSNGDQATIDAAYEYALTEADDRVNLKLIGAGVTLPFDSPSPQVTAQVRKAATLYAAGYLVKLREDQDRTPGSTPTQPTPGDALIAEGDAIMDTLVEAGALTETEEDDDEAGAFQYVDIERDTCVADEFSSN
jgi:hypothetical protein